MQHHCHHATVALEISSLKQLPSAQQRMYLVVVSRVIVRRDDGDDISISTSDERDVHRHVVDEGQDRWLLSFPVSWCGDSCTTSSSDKHEKVPIHPPAILVRILDALKQSNNRLVIREWRKGACWWNLNMNKDLDSSDVRCRGHLLSWQTKSVLFNQTTISMAEAEVAGYRVSRMAMLHYYADQIYNSETDLEEEYFLEDLQKLAELRTRSFIPDVLYFSHDNAESPPRLNLSTSKQDDNNNTNESDSQNPWAIMAYLSVNDAVEYIHNSSTDADVLIDCDLGIDVQLDTTTDWLDKIDPRDRETLFPQSKLCRHYPTTMIKVRYEFGFDEPHPRHGRVPSDGCLDYALMILRDVILPVHRYFFQPKATLDVNDSLNKKQIPSLGWYDVSTLEIHPFTYLDMVSIYSHAVHSLQEASDAEDENKKTTCLLRMLQSCIQALTEEWYEIISGDCPCRLPPVLCHMDLQPQNLSFCHTADDVDTLEDRHESKQCHVASVMDWEEACYADPRLEILLLCRKVLATREQAEILWRDYATFVKDNTKDMEIGPLEPWLKLETVHSLCTLMLQGTDLLGGGRNPWETKPDLWGKIDRERQRLVNMGWSFCEKLHLNNFDED
eukprot:g165.t1 g165   contig1:402720-404561(+)